jgi:hypothetical protein
MDTAESTSVTLAVSFPNSLLLLISNVIDASRPQLYVSPSIPSEKLLCIAPAYIYGPAGPSLLYLVVAEFVTVSYPCGPSRRRRESGRGTGTCAGTTRGGTMNCSFKAFRDEVLASLGGIAGYSYISGSPTIVVLELQPYAPLTKDMIDTIIGSAEKNGYVLLGYKVFPRCYSLQVTLFIDKKKGDA